MTVSERNPGEQDRSDKERRATVRLVHYWQSLRRNSGLPAFIDFDPHRNPVPWDNCFLASCMASQPPIFEHVGAGLVALDRQTSGTQSASSPEETPFMRHVARFISVVQRTEEVQHLEEGYRRTDGSTVLYRAVLLPFRGTREGWSYVLGAVTYRIGDRTKVETGTPDKLRAELEAGSRILVTEGG
mgnify:CR=1 FL=1